MIHEKQQKRNNTYSLCKLHNMYAQGNLPSHVLPCTCTVRQTVPTAYVALAIVEYFCLTSK